MKSEFLGSKVKELVSGYGGLLGAANAWFTDNELATISEFLTGYQLDASGPEAPQIDPPVTPKPEASPKSAPIQRPSVTEAKPEPAPAETVAPEQSPSLGAAPALTCKHCNNTEGLAEKSGRWGPYVVCPKCSKNTPIKEADQGSIPGKAPVAPPESQTQTPIEGEPQASVRPKAASTPEQKEAGWEIACKHCKNTEGLIGKSGKLGYYVACPECQKNTPMKSSCLKCHGKDTRVRKKKCSFTLNCEKCGDVGTFTAGMVK